MSTTGTVLPEGHSHQFTAADFDPEQLEQVEAVYERLSAMAIDDRAQLESFLEAWNETTAFVAEAGALLRLNSARFTDRDDFRERFLAFNRDLSPKISQWDHDLGLKCLSSPAIGEMKATLYAPFIRELENDVELFRRENIPIFRELAELDNRYGEMSGAWTVDFEGKERTLSELAVFLESPDRELRRRVWEARSERCYRDADALDALWDEMFQLRQRAARNAGFDNFRDFIFKAKMRDYGPDACFAYHDLIEAEVVPLVREMDEQRKELLGVSHYRPWDLDAEVDGAAPLSPFETVDELTSSVGRMMGRLDPELGGFFHEMTPFMDLDARPAKRQGGFMMTLPASRRPFIFANASGRHGDLVTLLHEAGHAFHSMLCLPNHPMVAANVPMEFNEVASMAMELLHYDTLDELYDDDQRTRAIRQHCRRIPRILTTVAQGDSFQQWLYTHVDHTPQQRRDRWDAERKRFTGHIETDGLNSDWVASRWHQILHFFSVPFYFIEYGFAYLGALQVAVNFEDDPAESLAAYKRALSLGAQRDTAGLYAEAGAQFVPTREKLRDLMNWIRRQLDL